MRRYTSTIALSALAAAFMLAGILSYHGLATDTSTPPEPLPEGAETAPASPGQPLLDDVELPVNESELISESLAADTAMNVAQRRGTEEAEPWVERIELMTIGQAKDSYYADYDSAPDWRHVDLRIPAYLVEIRGGPFSPQRGWRTSAPPLLYERLFLVVEAIEGTTIFKGHRDALDQ